MTMELIIKAAVAIATVTGAYLVTKKLYKAYKAHKEVQLLEQANVVLGDMSPENSNGQVIDSSTLKEAVPVS